MKLSRKNQPIRRSFAFVALLLTLCVALGILQYRWIGEVSTAERDRLKTGLQTSLTRLAQDLNSVITTSCLDLIPLYPGAGRQQVEEEFTRRYEQWIGADPQNALFHRIALLIPRGGSFDLRVFDQDQRHFIDSEWPSEWQSIHAGLGADGMRGRNFGLVPGSHEDAPFILPLIDQRASESRAFNFKDTVWVILAVDPSYVRDHVLPDLIKNHLNPNGISDFQVEVITSATPSTLIYRSKGEASIQSTADASIGLFDLQYDLLFRRMMPSAVQERDAAMFESVPSSAGRWRLFARHRAGSLEAVVARTQWRNSFVTASVLLLMMGSIAAFVVYTRRAQQLAELQMEFVAGISHELRTPLTAIYTAAYNLRRNLVREPGDVADYGAMIQRESGRLRHLVDEVLQFASASAGSVSQKRETLSLEIVLREALQASRSLFEDVHCAVEEHIDPDLPPITGDSLALQHAFQNLVSNAANHGSEGRWIGIFATRRVNRSRTEVEVRVADRGPGIPLEEQEHIFDPFFRGRRALQDQVHGTGLGLNLVKKIVEAHQGSIRVQSEPGKGTEFTVLLPTVLQPDRQANNHEVADSVS